jgi:tetratricopeptide (TPR) repeat protein
VPSGGVKGYVGAEDSADDVTRIVTPADVAEDATRFAAPADASEEATRFVAAGEARMVATPAPSDSLADAMTVVAPATPTPHGGRGRHTNNAGPLEVGQSFGPRYHIIRLLGAGGMGAVYQAWDAELGVAVAIKVIRPEVMEDPVTAEEVGRRFKRELLLARQVTHKNVVRIHDIGDIDGIKYITMSYVEGTDLASILKKDGKRPIPELLGIARSVISGLVAAHTAGVVHRDLKPANIMISKEGEALIMDFGIAHSTGDPAAAASKPGAGLVPEHLRRNASLQQETTLGSIVGTVEYMAPEQAKGQPIDERVDVYAFGLILYDALLGQRRVSSGAAAVEELQRRMAAPPPPLQALSSDIPGPLAALVARCVEPDAHKRFQTSAEVAAELGRLDEHGHLIPIRKTIGVRQMAAIVAVFAAIIGGGWWYFLRQLPATVPDTVGVVIADIANTTGDNALDGTLEPILKLALEEAGFINAFDRSSVRRGLGVEPPKQFDEQGAAQLAAKEGVRVVLAGTIAQLPQGYAVTLKASEAVTGDVIRQTDGRANGKDQILRVATRLAYDIREALGDDTSEAARRFAADTLSATSIDVVRQYAAGMAAISDGRFADARKSFEDAVTQDSNFGLAYAGMASMLRNLNQTEEAEKNIRAAYRLVDGMTERERYRTRGLFFIITHQYPQCIEEYTRLLTQYPADVSSRNNLAVCYTHVRRLTDAVDEMKRVVETMGRRALYRVNLSLYASYASQFREAEEAAAAALNMDVPGNTLAHLPLAFARVGLGRLPEAVDSYRMFARPLTPSHTAAGLADIAIYEGRYSAAIKILEEAVDNDIASKNNDLAVAKFSALAHAELLRGRRAAAATAAARVLQFGNGIRPRFIAARTLAQTGDVARAREIAAGLRQEPQAEARAYARIVEGNIALYEKQPDRAVALLVEGTGILDTWIGQFDLGRAYLEARRFLEADSAFDTCLRRRGEAVSLFLDESPTYGYLPMVYYLQGRAREGSGGGFAASYKTYIDLRGAAGEDPLLATLRGKL